MHIPGMALQDERDHHGSSSVEDKLKHFAMMIAEADTVREKDKGLIKGLFRNFYNRNMNVGVGFQQAYGSMLSGDFFDLIRLPDATYLFVFADISGHGLPAYTTLIRLRSAITIAIREIRQTYEAIGIIDTGFLVRSIVTKFTDVMDDAGSYDFACVNFTFIQNQDDKFILRFYNRSMLFPLVVRRYNNTIIDLYNLNKPEKGWIPRKGYLLGSDMRKLLEDNYLESPCCEFILYEGDSVLFFSDGIIEAQSKLDPSRDFGHEQLEEVVRENQELPPQLVIQELFESVYDFIGTPESQKDDMTAVMIEFPPVRY